MKRYGLIGHPLGHSFSKVYFQKKFQQKGWDCWYENFDLESLDQIRSLILDHPDLKGFNVTIPYKEAILPYLDELDPVAAEVGAVNTVKVLPDSKLKGYNTDVIGLELSLWDGLLRSFLPRNEKSGNDDLLALVLGTGGASKAVQYVLRKHHITFHTVSRSPERGDYTYQDLTPEVIHTHLLIINATPVGMYPNVNDAPALPYEALSSSHVLFDLIYNPEETLFLRHGREHGATTLNGLTMLHAQADASWEIWQE